MRRLLQAATAAREFVGVPTDRTRVLSVGISISSAEAAFVDRTQAPVWPVIAVIAVIAVVAVVALVALASAVVAVVALVARCAQKVVFS